MSLTNVRAYFRTRMNALGHKEWKDGFNFDNIPSNILHRAYHIESGPIVPGDMGQQGQEFESSVVVRLFVKGYRDPASAIDDAIEFGENILTGILNVSNRTGVNVKNVLPGSLIISPIADSNDNSLILEINFIAKTYLCYD